MRDTGQFRLRLDEEPALADIESDLKMPGNPFKPLLDRMGLLSTPPHIVGTRSTPALLSEKGSSREARLEAFADSLEKAYGIADRQEALKRFKADYDEVSAVLEAQRAGLPTPAMPGQLPLDNDPGIVVDTLRLANQIPMVHGVFEGMQGARFDLAIDLTRILPDDRHQTWIGLFPALLTQSGLSGPQGTMNFREVEDALRREVSWAGCWIDTDLEDGRADLVFTSIGADAAECARGIQWLQRFLDEADWSDSNRVRLHEIARRELAGTRDIRKGAEESWVDIPAAAWRSKCRKTSFAGCFLQQEFELLRAAHQLESASPRVDEALKRILDWPVRPYQPRSQEMFDRAIVRLTNGAADALEDSWTESHSALADSCRLWASQLMDIPDSLRARSWALQLTSDSATPLTDEDVGQLERVLRDLADFSSELPLDGFYWDWRRICEAMDRGNGHAGESLKTLRFDLESCGRARAWFTGSQAAWSQVRIAAEGLSRRFRNPDQPVRAAKLDHAVHDTSITSIDRGGPCYGLVNPGSSSGVLIITAPFTSMVQWTREDLLDYLTGNLLGGGSDQGLFMQTWAAGLAYSNGIRPRERQGTLRYYAERCPDVSQTLSFVEDCVRRTPPVDRARAETALVTAFGGSRGALDYDERTRQRALELQVANATDQDCAMPHRAGSTRLDTQRQFRRGLLDLLNDPDLPAALDVRKLAVHSRVFPGLQEGGWQPSEGTQLFVIGPEHQMDLMDQYLARNAPGTELVRLAPRDYWRLSTP